MTIAHENFGSLQMKGVAAVEVPVDVDAAATRLSKAITFPTISNQDRADFDEKAFNDLHRYLEKAFPLVHKKLKREILGEPRRFSLLYTWEGKDPSLPAIVLMGHQDVVPVVPGTEKNWEHPPFSGDIADGYIWGRGSLDDKGILLAIFEAIEMHLENGFQPARSIYVVSGQDEEAMGFEGVNRIAQVLESRGVGRDDIAFVLDEGLPLAPGLFPGISESIALIGTAEKGYATLQLKVTGPGGHSAMPPRSSNIGILAQAITRLEANPFPYRITQPVRDQFRFLGPELPERYHAVLADVASGGHTKAATDGHGEVQADEHTNCPSAGYTVERDSDDQFMKYMLAGPQTTAMLHTTTAVTVMDGGIKENVLPPSATALVNFRILQGETVASVTEQVKRIINDDRVEITALADSIDPSPISNPYGKEYQLIEKSIRQTWSSPNLLVSPYLVIGGTDSKYFAASIAKNVFRLSPVQVESAADTARWHGTNERVLVREYGRSIAFFHNLIANAAQL